MTETNGLAVHHRSLHIGLSVVALQFCCAVGLGRSEEEGWAWQFLATANGKRAMTEHADEPGWQQESPCAPESSWLIRDPASTSGRTRSRNE
jgi:hypothetical protein